MSHTFNRRFTLEDNDPNEVSKKSLLVRKIGGHDEVVLDDEPSFLAVHDESLNDLCYDKALLRVEVGTWFIYKVDVGWLGED